LKRGSTLYKTAEELGIKQWEYDGLIKTMEHLKHTRLLTVETDEFKDIPEGMYFNMGHTAQTTIRRQLNDDTAYKSYECGTVACIGGWNYLLSFGMKDYRGADIYVTTPQDDIDNHPYFYPEDTRGYSPALYDLYYPFGHGSWDNITPEVASNTIRHFLTTGDIDYKKFLPNE
jgi:hypothetical protein